MFKRNPLFVVHINSEVGIPPIPIFEKKFIVGRKPSHLVAIPDNSISRDHLEVILQSNQIYIMDMGTSNGTKVDGHRIPENIPTPYRQGQLIHLGNANVIITIELFDENREKRAQNPSAKAIQQLNMRSASTPYGSSPATSPNVVPSNSSNINPSHTNSQVFNHEISQPKISSNSAAPDSNMMTTSGSISFVKKTENLNSINSHFHNPNSQNHPHSADTSLQPSSSQPITQQTREDANRLIAKAKIEAEMAAKDLLKNKEVEAQKLLQQTESKIAERLKDTEIQIQQLLQNAKQEAQNLKQDKLNEALKEKEIIQKDAESLKKTLPSIMEQIEQLKQQSHKYLAEKNSIESLYTQEQLKLEKLIAEVKSKELQFNTLHHQYEQTQAKISEAESRYQSTVTATQSLVDETELSLERAKDKEREFQKLLENAQQEKQKSLEYSENQRADADAYAKVTREEADIYSNSLRDETEKWSQNYKSEIENEIKFKLENCNQIYQQTKASQEAVLEELRSTETIKIKNLQEIDSILKKKTEDYEESIKSRKENLEIEFEKRKDHLNSEFKLLKEKLESELTDRRSSIEKEMLERREVVERESAESKQRIENEAQELRALRDKEYKELKMQQDAYLFDIKKREEDRLKALFEESRAAIKEQFNKKSSYVKNSIQDFFTHYERTSAPESRELISDLQKQLTKVIHESLTNDLSVEDKHLQQLLEYDPNLYQKHKKYWMYFGVASIIILIISVGLLYNPSSISTGIMTIKETVNDIDLQNKKLQAEALEQIKKSSIYNPEKSKEFKKTYTNNVLYTYRYLDFERDEQYRNQWIVSIKEFLIQEAKIIDDKADEIIAKEGSLIIELSNESIDGRNPDRGLSRMYDKEAAFMALLATNLSEGLRNQFFEKKQLFFEQYLSDPIKSRSPANK